MTLIFTPSPNHDLTFNADCTLALREVENASRYGTIELSPGEGNRGRKIISFKEKNNSPGKGTINGGVYLLNKSIYLEKTPTNKNFSIEKDFFQTK